MPEKGGLSNMKTERRMRQKRVKLDWRKVSAAAVAMLLVVAMVIGLWPSNALAAISTEADRVTSENYANESFLGHPFSTEFAGRIWTDKSVETINNTNDFMVTYSALATSKQVTGKTTAPLDVVFVIDISGSMVNSSSGMAVSGQPTYSRMKYTVDALNEAIDEILAMNANTRVGVAAFSTTAQEILPLGRYTKQTGEKVYFSLSNDVPMTGTEEWYDMYPTLTMKAVDGNGTDVSDTITVSGGTNIQQGIYTGSTLVTAAANTTTVEIGGQSIKRIPAMILLSDGAPTYSTNSNVSTGPWYNQVTRDYWWAPNANSGQDGTGNSASYGNGMKAMMTGAYVKQLINEKYGVTDATSDYAVKIHTIGMGISDLTGNQGDLANITLNPSTYWNANNTMANNIRSKWQSYVNGNVISVGVGENNDDNLPHPNAINSDLKDITAINTWVDQYHSADKAADVSSVFNAIVSDLALSAPEIPTEMNEGETINAGAYLTYVDPIGEYMEVKDLEDMTLTFPLAGDDKGKTQTFENPTVSTETVNADGSKTVTVTFNAAVTGADNVVNGSNLSNILITLTTATDGSQTLEVKIPGNLIPLRVNKVELDEEGKITSHTHNSELPLRLKYKVGLRSDIYDVAENRILMHPTSMKNDAAALAAYHEYLEENRNEDGLVQFYSNLYTGSNKVLNYKTGVEHTVGDAYVTFEPSHTNPFYYIQETTPIYTDANFTTIATGAELNDDTIYYYREEFYHNDDIEVKAVARTGKQLKATSISKNAKGEWVRQPGSVRVNKIQLFEGIKSANASGTAQDFYAATFVHEAGNPDPYAGHFKIHLGNNGVLSAATTGSLVINKEVTAAEGHTAPNKDFTFTVEFENATGEYTYAIKNAEGNLVSDGDDKIASGGTIVLKAGQSVQIYNLPVNTKYKVTEAAVAGFTTKVNGTAGNVAEGTIISGEVEHVQYENHYSTTPVVVNEGGTTADFRVTKVLNGRPWNTDDSFTFILESNRVNTPMPAGSTLFPSEENPTHRLKEITITDTNEKAFGEIKYTQPGTYTYTISERVPTPGVAGITYSGAMYQVIVTVSDNGEGALTKTVEMYQLRDDDGLVAQLDEGVLIPSNTATITNDFTVGNVGWTPVGTKDYTDNSGTNGLINGMFDFEISVNANSPSDTPLPSVTKVSNVGPQISYDVVTFTSSHVKNSTPGKANATKYIYDFTEVLPTGANAGNNNTVNGMKYDARTIQVEVYVYYNSDMRIVVEPVYPAMVDGTHYNRVVFFNEYTPTPVTLGDNGYAPFGGQKTLVGRDWQADDSFEFVLSTDDAATKAAITAGTVTGFNTSDTDRLMTSVVTNNTAKAFTFDDVTFTKPGTYKFQITETQGSIGGITYDAHVTDVTVVVTDTDTNEDGKMEGQLVAQVTYDNRSAASDTDKAVTNAAAFTNTYAATQSAPISLNGTKVLTGRELKEGEFFFTVQPQLVGTSTTEYAPMGDTLAGNGSSANGAVTLLKNITYTKTGEYVYLIKEHIPSDAQKLGGVTYDKTIYRVTVSVTDIRDNKQTGQLVATVAVAKSTDGGANYTPVSGDVNDAIAFTNEYKAANAVYTPVNLWKILNGRDLEADQFEFTLTAVENPNGGMTLPANTTVKNALSGEIKFGNITFTKAGTYKVEITEVKEIKAGYAYSDNKLEITFVVTDNGRGNLEVARNVTGGTTVFVNEYETKGTLSGETYLKVKKEFTGRNWMTGDEFTFNLQPLSDNAKAGVADGSIDMNADGNGTPQSVQVTISYADAVKEKAFGNIRFTKPGTYTFSLTEEVPATPIPGVEYDVTSRTVTVVATDNGDGSMAVVSSIAGGTGLTFNNKYEAQETILYGRENLQVTKDLQGRNWLTDETFYFTLSVEDATTQAAINAVQPKIVMPGTLTIAMTRDNQNELSFGNIIFKEAGTYQFVIKETNANGGAIADAKGLTYDKTYETVTVVIDTDTQTTPGEAILYVKSVTSVDGGNGATQDTGIHFVNVYNYDSVTLKGETDLAISKELTGRKWNSSDKFTFELTPYSDRTKQAVKPDGDGFVAIDLNGAKAGTPEKTAVVIENITSEAPAVQKAFFDDITFYRPGTYTFMIKEVAGSIDNIDYDTHEVIVTVVVTDDKEGALVTAAPSYNGAMTFVNTYTPDPIKVTLNGIKTLKGRDFNDAERFLFHMEVADGSAANTPLPAQTKITTSAKTADENNWKPVEFAEITYNKAGIYIYHIHEQAGSIAGITYDDTEWTITVKVTYNDVTGKFEVEVDSANNNNVTIPTEDGREFTFTNVYDAADADPIVLQAQKEVTVVGTAPYVLNGDEFEFVLKSVAGNPSDDPVNGELRAKNKADGSVTFDGITFKAPGEYNYIMVESHETKIPGMNYDYTHYDVKVVVTDNYTSGKLDTVVTITRIKEGTSEGTDIKGITFKNVYDPTDATAGFGGVKTLKDTSTGEYKHQEAGMFKFKLTALNNAPMPKENVTEIEAASDEDGVFEFVHITYTSVGEYKYRISEVKGDKSYIGYDETVYTVVVNVTDVNGALLATATYYRGSEAVAANKVDQSEVVFANTYTPAKLTGVVVEGTKTLTGRDMNADEFTFELVQDGKVVATAKNSKASAGEAAKFTLHVPEITKAGEYTYTVREVAGKTANGVTYDDSIYTVILTVEDVNAELKVTAREILKEQEPAEITFGNSYKAKATEASFSITKLLEGCKLIAGEFVFELRNAEGEVIERVKNDADGVAKFAAIHYDVVGTYTYTIVEVIPEGAVKNADGTYTYNNVTYDNAVYTVTVTVTDNYEGTLETTTKYTKGDKETAAVFRNVYNEPVEKAPQTGDTSSVVAWTTLMLASMVVCGAVLVLKKKRS